MYFTPTRHRLGWTRIAAALALCILFQVLPAAAQGTGGSVANATFTSSIDDGTPVDMSSEKARLEDELARLDRGHQLADDGGLLEALGRVPGASGLLGVRLQVAPGQVHAHRRAIDVIERARQRDVRAAGLERQHQLDYMRRILEAFDRWVRPEERPVTEE